MYPERVVERVLSRWNPNGECWISKYSLGSHGYAQVGWSSNGKTTMTLAHRVAWWSIHRTPIPKGITVDHLCHVKRCVNPSHLRLLPNLTNASDNGSANRRTSVQIDKKCIKGHPKWRSLNTGRVFCMECKRLESIQRNAKRRAARRAQV